MSTPPLKSAYGVEETRQMLEFREAHKSRMSPEEWEQNMQIHTQHLQWVMNVVPGTKPGDAATAIVSTLDADVDLDGNQREIWKAMVVIAAFEMQEF